MTFICVSILVEDVVTASADAEAARAAGADLIEWRVDAVADDIALVERLVRESPLPCIVTCRRREEGGEYGGDEAQRIALLEHVGLHARPRYLDVELAAFERSANLRQKVKLAIRHPDQLRNLDSTLILSSHDFTGRPADLLRRIERMAAEVACEVIKIAWMARSLRDNLEAFEILRARHKPTIALCMGPMGLMSRVLAPKFGALLTFASLRPAGATAPGQPTVEDLVQGFRFRRIGPDTRVFGVIGWPVEHSRSPAIHNAAFERADFNGVYLPLPVAPDEIAFRTTLEALLADPALTFRGASVTIPHKTNLLRFVRCHGGMIEHAAEMAGAANTLVVHEDGLLEARNTDIAGIVDSVAAVIGTEACRLKERCIRVIGAGGMARAAVAGFAHLGCTVVVYHRNFDKARRLAEEFAGKAEAWGRGARIVAERIERLGASRGDVLINATPVGMAGGPDPDGLPFPAETTPAIAWDAPTLVVDAVYAPECTALLRLAAARGAATLGGHDLLLRQAFGQFKAWTGGGLTFDDFARAAPPKGESGW